MERWTQVSGLQVQVCCRLVGQLLHVARGAAGVPEIDLVGIADERREQRLVAEVVDDAGNSPAGTVNLAQDFSPLDALSTGRSITWGELAKAIGQIVFLLGGLFAAAGIFFFNRRELATSHSQH